MTFLKINKYAHNINEKISKRKIFSIRFKSTTTTIKKESSQAEKITMTPHTPPETQSFLMNTS